MSGPFGQVPHADRVLDDEPVPINLAAAGLRVRVLGALQVAVDGRPIVVGGSARRVLALLATRPGRVFSVAAVAQGLWGEAPPAGWEGAVQSYVSRLRRALGDAGIGVGVLTRAPGYLLDIDPDAVDAEHFGRLVAQGRRAAAAGQPALAADRLGQALDLWRGESAYDDLDDAAFVDAERARLALTRLDAMESYQAARLAIGDPVPVEDLEALVVAHPHRERLWVQLATALYRSGRQAGALEACRRARLVLADDLGVDVGPELAAVQSAVLRHDPVLLYQPSPPAELPAELTPCGPLFVGRDGELASLAEALDLAACAGTQLRWISGPSGSGRTRLAAALAAVAAERGADVHFGRSVVIPPAGGMRLTVLIADDLENREMARFAALARAADRPLLCVGVTGPEAPDGALVLGPLPPRAVAAIAAAYGIAGTEAAATPAAVHDALVAAATRRCAARVSAATAQEPSASGPHHDEAVAAVAELQAALALRAAHRPLPAQRCPYPGLARFDQDDAGFFHGREAVAADMAARLAGPHGRFLAIVGASGSGKSSLVQAGLIPLLAAGALPGAGQWRVVAAAPSRTSAADIATQLDASVPVLFVVDQFEELFTMVDEPGRAKFIDVLIAAVAAGHRVVVTLRADFFGHCAVYPALAELVAMNTVLLGPMTAEQLRRAAEAPGHATGLTFEPDLVDRMLAELDGAAGSLPLLSAALRALWEQRHGRELTLSAYERAGGVAGAIAGLGESAYGLLTPDQQATARRLLVRLAVAGDDGLPARCWMSRADWDEVGGAEAAAVLAVLAERRLLSVDGDGVAVAHEALFHRWPRLAAWLDEDRAGRAVHGRLTSAARDWISSQRDAHLLWRGGRLAAAAELAAARPDTLTGPERQFVDAGIAAEAAEQQRQRTSLRRLRLLLATVAAALVLALIGGSVAVLQRREADAASLRADARRLGALASTERDMRKAMLLAVTALRLDDSRQSRSALLATLLRSPRLISAGGENDGDRLLGMTLSADGTTIATTSFSGRVRLYDAATLHARGDPARPGPQPAFGSAFLPGGRLLVWGRSAGPGRGGLRVWDTATGQPSGDAQGPGTVMIASPLADPQTVLAMEGDGSIARWDLRTGTRVEIAAPGSAVWMVSAAGRRFAAYLTETRTVLVDTATGATVPLPVAAGGAVAVSADGTAVLTTGPDRTALQLWRRGSHGPFQLAATGLRHTAAIQAAAWSADAGQIVSCGDDGLVVRWDPTTMKPLDVYAGHTGRVTSCAFAPDGRTIYSASLDGALLAWDTTATRGLETITAPSQRGMHLDRGLIVAGARRAVALSRDTAQVLDVATGRAETPPIAFGATPVDVSADTTGDNVAAIFGDGRAQVWSTATGRPTGPEIHTPGSRPEGIALAADDSLLAVATDTNAYLYDPRTGRQLGTPLALPDGVQCLAISRDHHWLAAGLADGRVIVVDLRTGADAAVLEANPPEYPVWQVAFSPDGRLLAAGGVQGRPALWQVDGWTRRWKAQAGHTGYDLELSFSADSAVLASSGTDARVFLYDALTGDLIGTALGPPDNLWTYAAYAPDRAELVALGEDGSLHRWDLDPDSWVRRACAIAGRELTRDEWNELLPGRAYRPVCAGGSPVGRLGDTSA